MVNLDSLVEFAEERVPFQVVLVVFVVFKHKKMKLDYKFNQLCATVYKKGNLTFTADGNSLLSPVGNRINVYHLTTNHSITLDLENSKDIALLALSPDQQLLISVDVDGRALLINFPKLAVLHHFNFKTKVLDIKFSPNGKFIAVTHETQVHVWHCPGFTLEFAPFRLFQKYPGHYDHVTHITWSADSSMFLTSSNDMTCRLYSLADNTHSAVLTGHRDTVLGAWFSADGKSIFSISKDGSMFHWASADGETIEEAARNKRPKVEGDRKVMVQKWIPFARHYFNQNHAKVSCANFHPQTGLLSVGFYNGVFGIWELPDFLNVHTLRYNIS